MTHIDEHIEKMLDIITSIAEEKSSVAIRVLDETDSSRHGDMYKESDEVVGELQSKLSEISALQIDEKQKDEEKTVFGIGLENEIARKLTDSGFVFAYQLAKAKPSDISKLLKVSVPEAKIIIGIARKNID